MNSSADSPMQPKPSSKEIRPLFIWIRDIGHVPAMKNSKMLTRGKLITNPKRQQWMEKCIQSIESQLTSYLVMQGGEILMGALAQSLTAWSKQFDDSRQWIPEIVIKAYDTPKGHEGCNIMIEEITD